VAISTFAPATAAGQRTITLANSLRTLGAFPSLAGIMELGEYLLQLVLTTFESYNKHTVRTKSHAKYTCPEQRLHAGRRETPGPSTQQRKFPTVWTDAKLAVMNRTRSTLHLVRSKQCASYQLTLGSLSLDSFTEGELDEPELELELYSAALPGRALQR
jgi:hypothetical protein